MNLYPELKQPVQWVESNAQLEACCDIWKDLTLLALDTEFIRTTTYYPIAGLFQMNDGQKNYLIDPTKIDDWYPLIEIFEDSNIQIALHGCSEDLEVFQIELGVAPATVLDTQIAMGFLGDISTLGYAALIEQELGVSIPKSETRSDWLQRPLSKAQIHYAALDVEYLYQVAVKVIERLEQKNRLTWVHQEGRRLYRNFKRLQDVQQSYKRVKQAWKLAPRKLAVLMGLSKWRENYAQQKNIPRNRVMKENVLFDLALQCPKQLNALHDIDGLQERIIRQYGKDILKVISEALAVDESALPERLPAPLSREAQKEYKVFKSSVHTLSNTLNIAPDIFLRKKELEAIYRNYKSIGELNPNQEMSHCFDSWRKDWLNNDILKILESL